VPEYARPTLLTADQTEVAQWLLSKAMMCSIRKDATAMIITIAGTSADLDAALTGFPNLGFYRAALPGTLSVHIQHLASYLAATPAQIAGLTQAQKDHVLQDCVLALKLAVDDRLG